MRSRDPRNVDVSVDCPLLGLKSNKKCNERISKKRGNLEKSTTTLRGSAQAIALQIHSVAFLTAEDMVVQRRVVDH